MFDPSILTVPQLADLVRAVEEDSNLTIHSHATLVRYGKAKLSDLLTRLCIAGKFEVYQDEKGVNVRRAQSDGVDMVQPTVDTEEEFEQEVQDALDDEGIDTDDLDDLDTEGTEVDDVELGQEVAETPVVVAGNSKKADKVAGNYEKAGKVADNSQATTKGPSVARSKDLPDASRIIASVRADSGKREGSEAFARYALVKAGMSLKDCETAAHEAGLGASKMRGTLVKYIRRGFIVLAD